MKTVEERETFAVILFLPLGVHNESITYISLKRRILYILGALISKSNKHIFYSTDGTPDDDDDDDRGLFFLFHLGFGEKVKGREAGL